MPGTLNAAQAERLVKICGMLGSEHAGERAAAALKASHLLQEYGASWQDLLVRGPAAVTPRPPSNTRNGPPDAHQARILWALTFRPLLSDWELNFLNVVSRQQNLTTKQLRKLDEIIADIVRRDAA